MTLRRRIFRGTAYVTLGEGVGYVASFVRNMILARVLSKADFGLAAVLGMVLSLLEFTAKLSVGRFLVQDKEGDNPDFVATGHTLQTAAGVVSAIAIVVLAPWLALWFGIRDHAWALALLAGVVFVRGLEHLDVRRFERHLRFGPSAAVEAVPQIVITLAAWPLAQWFGDYRAVLVLLLAKVMLSCGLSHLWAEQRFRWTWRREYAVRMLRFGWPLILTGFLMFGIMQGDQFVIATFYSMEELAPYAAAVALVMAPQFLVGRVFNSVSLPLMARVQDDPVEFGRRYRQVMGVMSLYAAVATAGMIVGAEAFMRFVYGPKYVGAGTLMAWLAVVAAFRSLRIAVAVANLAKGDSQSQLIANLFRATSLGPAFWVAWRGEPLWLVAACGLLGEGLAIWVCGWRLRQREGLPLGATLRPALGIFVLAGVSGVLGAEVARAPFWGSLAAACVCAVAAGALTIWVRPELRAEARVLWAGLQSGGPRAALRVWVDGSYWRSSRSECGSR